MGKAAVAELTGEQRSRLRSHRGNDDGMSEQEDHRNTGDPRRQRMPRSMRVQPDAREGQAGPRGESERPMVPSKPGNAGGGKGPQFKVNVRRNESREIGLRLTPLPKVRKLQETLHAKAKSAPMYRFYA